MPNPEINDIRRFFAIANDISTFQINKEKKIFCLQNWPKSRFNIIIYGKQNEPEIYRLYILRALSIERELIHHSNKNMEIH